MFAQVSPAKLAALKEALMSNPNQKWGLIQPSRWFLPVPRHLVHGGFWSSKLAASTGEGPFRPHLPGCEQSVGLQGVFSAG